MKGEKNMLKIDRELHERYINVFVTVCEELAEKLPDKTDLFRAMTREANEYLNFPIVDNLCYLVVDYYDELSDETIRKFVQLRA